MKYFFFIGACLVFSRAYTQTINDLTDLSAYKPASATWKTGGDVSADLNAQNKLTISSGTGVLANIVSGNTHGQDLYTLAEHGDADIECEFMMAKGSNSGIYLQGRYEIQLYDSWGVVQPASHDNGGIYERWDDSRPEGAKGFDGVAPRQNVTRAPGTWQRLKISFQAPKFNGTQKTENARILRIELNGVTIHENVELASPTRGAAGAEQATGPLRIQGDHGSIAFRNFRLVNYNNPRPELKNVRYEVYRGMFEKEPDFKNVRYINTGELQNVSMNINNLPDTFLIRYTGILHIKQPGEYNFDISSIAGKGLLRINKKQVTELSDDRAQVKTTLPAGELPFELLFTKIQDWGNPAIVIRASGPGIRQFVLSDGEDMSAANADPILIDAPANTLLRSFMDVPGMRVVHAVSVGSPQGVHYTYDMDRGAVVQVWRGGFLDATPMWHERGDGSSRPTGTVQLLGEPALCIDKLPAATAVWKKDTTGAGFRTKGYSLDGSDRPVFRYMIGGAMVTDSINVLNNNIGLQRTISLKGDITGMYSRIVSSRSIEPAGDGLYLIDNKSYYIRIDDAAGAAPVVRESNGKKELIVPVQSKLTYSILF